MSVHGTRDIESEAGRRAGAGPRWGVQGSCLVPESLRAALGTVPLPAWAAGKMSRAEGAAVADLDAGVWQTMTALDARLGIYLRTLIADSRLSDRRVWGRPWPLGLLPSMLPLSRRAANVLVRCGLANDAETLSVMTYGQLLAVEGIGPGTVLEVACAADAVLAASDYGRVSPPADVVRDLQAYAFQPWSAQVGSHDPRFSALLPPRTGELRARILSLKARPNLYAEARELLAAMPAVERRCGAIAAMALEDAVHDLVACATGFPPSVCAAVIARLGWGGEPPMSYGTAAALAGLHRASMVRRVQVALARFFRRDALYLPGLDRALGLLAAAVPRSAGGRAALLAVHGISRRPFAVESLRRLAEAFGRTVPAAVLALVPERPPRGRSPKRRRKKPRLRLVRSR